MVSTRRLGWPTSSHASPPILPTGWMSCCPGIGRLRRQRSRSERRDHARQQGPSRHHYRPRCRTPRRRRRLATPRRQRNGNRGRCHLIIWVYSVGEDGVLAFTDFGIESLIELVKMYKNYPTFL